MQAIKLLISICRRLRLGPFLISMLVVYWVCCFLLWKLDPNLGSLGNAMWFGFILETTIGFGDYTVTTWPARIVAMILGLYGDITIIFTTGVLTSWIYERWQATRSKSVTQFMDQLERLPELNEDELDELERHIQKN